jgi:hypothetical protein
MGGSSALLSRGTDGPGNVQQPSRECWHSEGSGCTTRLEGNGVLVLESDEERVGACCKYVSRGEAALVCLPLPAASARHLGRGKGSCQCFLCQLLVCIYCVTASICAAWAGVCLQGPIGVDERRLGGPGHLSLPASAGLWGK